MTQGGKHSNTVFWITLSKTEAGFYFVDLGFLFPFGREDFTLNDILNIDLSTGKTVKPGQSWTNNPFKQVVDYCTGYIEAKEEIGRLKKVEVTEEMKLETERLFDCFPVPLLSAMSDIPQDTIRQWKSRGIVSREGAEKICSLPQVLAMGFSVDGLRGGQ